MLKTILLIQEGQEVDVYVLRIDPETRRISLSLRRAKPDPWAEMVRKYDHVISSDFQ